MLKISNIMSMKLIAIFLFMVFFCMGFTLPSQKGPDNFDFETINLFKNNYKEGLITGFLGDPSLRGTVKQSSYWMSKKQVFKGKYLISNCYDEDKEFIFFCLFDYKQVEIGLNKAKKVTHRLSLKKGGEIIVPIYLDVLPKGAHDIIFVLADVSKDQEKISVNTINTHRANVFVESTTFPKINLVSISSKKAELENSIFKINKNKNKKEDITIEVNNNSDSNLESVSLLFSNFSQLDGGKFFFNLDKNKQASIPYKIKEKNGMIFCLKINNPYTVLEPKPKILTDINTAVDISNQIFF